MKNYVTWTLKPVEWGFEHPITHDQDQSTTWWAVKFTETPYMQGNLNIGIIEYDATVTTYDDLVAFAAVEPAFNLTIVDEAFVNSFLTTNYWGEVTASNFVFTDNRVNPNAL